MKCPYCGYKESKVVDSRPAEEGSSIRRRRECLSCGKRFTTYETVESMPMVVVKRDGSRQTFDRRKLVNGMLRACEKRPVSVAQLEKIGEEIVLTCGNQHHGSLRSVCGGCSLVGAIRFAGYALALA